MLLSHLNLLATAPGGVARLRELILTLAVQGKLVPQDPSDEPASALLKEIRAEKDRLIAEGKIKRNKPLAEIAEEEKPFGLPSGWSWARFPELGQFGRGKSKHRPRNDPALFNPPIYPVVQTGEVARAKGVIHEYHSKYSEVGLAQSRLWPAGTLCITIAANIADAALLGFDACFPDSVVGFIPAHAIGDSRYFLAFMATARTQLIAYAPATAQKNINLEILESVLIPIPPAKEMSRIVTRVEELMRLCDALEAKGQLEATQHAQLICTLLATLTDRETPALLADNWHRIATHFDLLLDRPEAVDALDQTILQLAVRGLLVPQDPQDEPASVLLKEIRAEKDKLLAEGKIKRDKPLPPIAEEEEPFALPQGWEWARVADLCSMVTDGEHLTPTRCDDATQVPLVTAKNVRHEVMDYRVTDYVPQDVAKKCWQRCKPLVGDILMVSVGATLGRLCVLREPLDMVLVRSVTVLRPVHVGVYVDFFALHLMSQNSQNEIWREVKQSAQPCLYLAKSAALKIALPPLAEQSRIVTRVAQLRRLCADLRQRLSARQSTQAHLAEALVADISA